MITEIAAELHRELGNTVYEITYVHNSSTNIIKLYSYKEYMSILEVLVKSQVDKTIPYQRVIYKKEKR